jgi:hypothetical protein
VNVVVPVAGHEGSAATLILRPPEGAEPEPEAALPVVPIPTLPGSRIAARLGYRSGPLTLRAACLAAPANGWAPGVEEIVLGRATQLAREALAADVAPFTVGERAAVGPRFEQRFEGVVRRDPPLSLHGRHWLGFTAEQDAFVCTVMCTEPEGASKPACEALIEATTPGGTWAEAPPPNLLARTLLLAAEQPREAMAVLAVVSIAAAAIVIARRPRPRAFP